MDRHRTVTPVVLSGGFGTRLWPASRRHHPKQLLPLVDDRTMFRSTIERVSGPMFDPPVVVCNDDHRLGIQRELRRAGIDDGRLILEPVGRNTAPAAAAAAVDALCRGDDPLLLILPADHVIGDLDAFLDAVEVAADLATRGLLMTFGASPTYPETGYGYIRFGEPVGDGPARRVLAFKEKPDRETAERYLAEGSYLWNSGMFVFRSSTYLEELERFQPEIVTAVRRSLDLGSHRDVGLELEPDAFAASPSISIDYAVMEHTDRAGVVPLVAGWSDVGSWSALWDLEARDDDGNVLVGDVEALDTTNSYIRAGSRLVATVGVEDAIIVDTPDALLVTTRDHAQDVKTLVDRLTDAKRSEVETDGSEDRPWGRFVTLKKGPGFRVLRMWLDPGGKTSLQTHEHRSEYWIVVRGVARVRTGDTTRLVPARESVFIPAGEIHRLENPEDDEMLEVIEVDVGTYVGEDDIRRFADVYGRGERLG